MRSRALGSSSAADNARVIASTYEARLVSLCSQGISGSASAIIASRRAPHEANRRTAAPSLPAFRCARNSGPRNRPATDAARRRRDHRGRHTMNRQDHAPLRRRGQSSAQPHEAGRDNAPRNTPTRRHFRASRPEPEPDPRYEFPLRIDLFHQPKLRAGGPGANAMHERIGKILFPQRPSRRPAQRIKSSDRATVAIAEFT